MKFDLFSLMQKRDESWSAADVFRDLDDHVRIAEQGGFETAWFAEHHFFNYCLCPSPLLAAAYFAGRTERIRLGTAVVVLPLYEPSRLVQEIGMVDTISNGRLVVGVGSGYQPFEFERFRLSLDEAIDRTMEVLDIIELGLTQGEFEYNGQHYQYPRTVVASRSVQQPLPEIWVAGLMSHPKVQRRVAESGYVPMLTPSWNPMSTMVKARDAYQDLYRSIGRDPADLPFGLMRFVHVTDNRQHALEAAERARYSSRVSLSFRLDYGRLNGIYAEDLAAEAEPSLEEMVDNYIIGDVEHCIQTIVEDYELMHHSHVLFNVQLGGVPGDRVLKTLEALASDVIPGVQKELASRGAKDPVIVQTPAAPGMRAA